MNKPPKYVFVDFSQRPLPKVEVSNDYKEWRRITDPTEIAEILKNKPGYMEYMAETNNTYEW